MSQSEAPVEASANGVALDFSHYKTLDVSEATAEWRPPLITGAVFICRPAWEVNHEYRDAIMAIESRRQRLRKQAVTGIEEETSELDRQDDLRVFPGTVIIGWRDVFNNAGQEVPFSVEACAVVLKSLPDWLINRLLVFVKFAENFTDALPAQNPVEMAKN